MQRYLNGALLALIVVATASAPALARGNDLIIKDGMGEEVQIKHGFFGRKTTVMKDRLGNGYSSKQGLFGNKDQSVSVLGNSVKRKKGLFGGSTIEGSTILGDKVETKRGIFGRKTTTIDASGISSAARHLWNTHKDGILGKTPASTPNGNMNLDNSINGQSSAAPEYGNDIGSTGNSN